MSGLLIAEAKIEVRLPPAEFTGKSLRLAKYRRLHG
jgi:hypothetical protein